MTVRIEKREPYCLPDRKIYKMRSLIISKLIWASSSFPKKDRRLIVRLIKRWGYSPEFIKQELQKGYFGKQETVRHLVKLAENIVRSEAYFIGTIPRIPSNPEISFGLSLDRIANIYNEQNYVHITRYWFIPKRRLRQMYFRWF